LIGDGGIIKMKYEYVIASLLGILLLAAGCVTRGGNLAGSQTDGSSLKELCQADGNMFMKMGPVLNGVPTGEPACEGCMIGNSHICNKEEYIKTTGR